MTQAERRLYLIRSLLNEKTKYQSLNVPRDAGEQRKLLRSLMNVRMPKVADEAFLRVQDEYLQQELADEGINLSHCVGDYISRVASGDCHILFLRRKHAPDQSLVTLQLSGQSICQAQGLNRRSITSDERKFLCNWARENNIQIAV